MGALEGMDGAIPNKSSFTRARQRLGAGVSRRSSAGWPGRWPRPAWTARSGGGCGWPRWTVSCSTCRTGGEPAAFGGPRHEHAWAGRRGPPRGQAVVVAETET